MVDLWKFLCASLGYGSTFSCCDTQYCRAKIVLYIFSDWKFVIFFSCWLQHCFCWRWDRSGLLLLICPCTFIFAEKKYRSFDSKLVIIVTSCNWRTAMAKLAIHRKSFLAYPPNAPQKRSVTLGFLVWKGFSSFKRRLEFFFLSFHQTIFEHHVSLRMCLYRLINFKCAFFKHFETVIVKGK